MSEESGHTFGSVAPVSDIPIPQLPSLRPVQPKFNRPGISIRRDLKREWTEVLPDMLTAGDTVAEVGQLAVVMKEQPTGDVIRVENVMGYEFFLKKTQKVLAFIVAND